MSEGLQKGFVEDFENDIISFESCQYDSKIEELIIPKQAKMVANCVLFELSRSDIIANKTVTYGDVSTKCENKYHEYIKPSNSGGKTNKKTGRIAKNSIGRFADYINAFSAKYGIPFITSKIVALDANGNDVPKDGFFKSLKSYPEIYNYNMPENIDKMSRIDKLNILKDINNKIEDKFDVIIDTFKILNNKKFFIIDNTQENTQENIVDSEELIAKIDSNDISETDRKAYINVRIGQSELRYKKLKEIGCCELCGIKTPELLIASHIKPWADSDKTEKVDTENILLLCAMHDALFDKGLISFDKNGKILISNKLSEEEQALLNIHDETKIDITSNRKIKYLDFHKKEKFKNC